jgi:hypothetical protein
MALAPAKAARNSDRHNELTVSTVKIPAADAAIGSVWTAHVTMSSATSFSLRCEDIVSGERRQSRDGSP